MNETGSSSDDSRPRLSHERWWVAWFSVLFVAAIGVANGISNQNLYMLYGLRLSDPGFLPGDWFTWQTVPSHHAYGWLISWFARTPFLELWMGLGVVLQNLVFALSSYAIVRRIYARPVVPWAAMLMVFSALDTMSLGAAPWMKPFFGASTLSSAAMTLALAFLVYRRFLAAGVAMGAAGLFHAHFFVLALPPMFAATLALVWPPRQPRWGVGLAMLWGAFLVVSSPSVFQVVRFTTAPGLDEIRWLTPAIFPYHVDPQTWGKEDVLALVGSVLLGYGGFLLRRPRGDRFLGPMILMIAAAVFVSFVLARFGLLDLASRTWPWRLSPLVLASGLTAGFAGAWAARRPSLVAAALWLLGCAAMVRMSRSDGSGAMMWMTLLFALTALVAGLRAAGKHWVLRQEAWTLLVLASISLAFVPEIRESAARSHLSIRPQDPERAGLYTWIRENTDTDAVFAVPPSWEGFRLNARRPIVADWKAVPRYPKNRIEWLQRMQDLTGTPRPSSNRLALDAAFEGMDCARAEVLRARYGVRYVVLNARAGLACGRRVYDSPLFQVYELGGDSSSVRGPDS